MNQLNVTQAKLCACANLRMASRVMTQFYDEILQPSGLRATQFTLLVALSTTGPVTITDLAEALVMDRTTLTRNLKPLEKQGLIESISGEDRRTRLVMLTEPGRTILAEAMPLWEQAQAKIVNGLGTDVFNHLLRLLSESIAITQTT